MLANFIVTINAARKPLAVEVKVHNSTAALRMACTQYCQRTGAKEDADFSDTVGICHRFHMADDPVCALVRLAPPHIGIGVVSHELAHVAVWMREIELEFKPEPFLSDDDEWFCWILGELVSFTVAKLYENGVYKTNGE
jgi:hypothetical protein